MVVLCPDTGRNYMSKMYDDKWLAANNLQMVPEVPHTVAELLTGRGERSLVTIAPTATAADAADLFRARGISQLPVLDRGKPVGSIHEVTLARVLHDHRDPTKVTVGEVMARPLPQLDVGTHLDEAYRLLLSGNTGVLATQNGEVVGIVTRMDLIDYWTRQRATSG